MTYIVGSPLHPDFVVMADTVATDGMECNPKEAEQVAEMQPAPEAHAGDKRAADEVPMDEQPPVKHSKVEEVQIWKKTSSNTERPACLSAYQATPVML